jgi:hypothetical protein
MKGEIMPCKEKIPKGLGEAIENTHGRTGVRKEVFPAKSANEKPRGRAIKSPKYKSSGNTSQTEVVWR